MFKRQDAPAAYNTRGRYWQPMTTQSTRRRAVLALGRVDDVLGQQPVVGFRVLTDNGGLTPGLPQRRHRGGGHGPVDGSGRGGAPCGGARGPG